MTSCTELGEHGENVLDGTQNKQQPLVTRRRCIRRERNSSSENYRYDRSRAPRVGQRTAIDDTMRPRCHESKQNAFFEHFWLTRSWCLPAHQPPQRQRKQRPDRRRYTPGATQLALKDN